MNRREFIGGAAALAVTGCVGDKMALRRPAADGLIKCLYMQLGQHMWRGPMDTFGGKVRGDKNAPYDEGARWVAEHWDRLQFDNGSWRRIVEYAAKRGFNAIQLDLAEGVKYPSHPELAVSDSWSAERLRDEVRRLADMGIELIPSLNFSAAHDIWLGEYSRMISTRKYYQVCADLIGDVCEICATPRVMSIGYDEESPRLQRNQAFCVCRQGDLWWHDLYWFVNEVEKRGARAQMAADYAWGHKEEFLKRAPRSVLQTNWYYGAEFDPKKMVHPEYLLTYDELEKAGFDQMPGCGNDSSMTNIGDTVRYCKKVISPERLKGFQVSIWRSTLPEHEQRHFDAIDQLAETGI